MKFRQVKRGARRGGAAVELAVTMVPLVVLFAGILDLGRVYRAHIIITDCARNGAAYLADPVSGNAATSPYADYKAAALADSYRSDGTSLLSPALTTGNVSSSTGTDADGNPCATVTVTYSFPLSAKENKGPLSDWTLVYRTPGRIVELDVPFAFKDLALP